MAKKTRKCGYCRVSTKAEEQEHSLLFMTQYFKGLIESERDSVFVGIYADTRSGKTARLRKQFKAMIRACKRGEIDYIITKSIARFARNLEETLRIVRELREIGVGVFFQKENIDTLKSSSDFILSIYALAAEKELDSMGEQVKWSARKRFANGSVELPHLYGYNVENGKITSLIPHEAAVVREVFELYAGGAGYESIARILNSRGVKRKYSSELWSNECVTRILENEKYMGDAILQKEYHENFKPVKNDGSVIKQYYVENNHPPIVTRELWEKVQTIRAERSAAAKRSPIKLSPFTGKIKCAGCGKGYKHRKNNRNSPYEKWIWSCYTYVHMGREYCGGHNIRENDFIRLFLSAYNEAAGFQPHEIQDLDGAIKDLLAQERELIALKAKGYMKREDYETQHAELLTQIRETEDAYTQESRRSGDELQAADEYSDRLAASLEVAEVDGFTITFKFKNGAEVKRVFNNDADRKATWANKKIGGIAI